jgi:hypothetical protein
MTKPAPTQTLSITPQVDQAKLTQYASASTAELLALSPLIISDPETATIIAQELAQELGRIDEMAAMKKEALTPLASVKKTIEGWFKPGLDTAQTLVTMYKNALAAWDKILQAEREAQLQAAGAAARAGDVPALTQALTAVNQPDTKPEGITYVRRWVARVINPAMVPWEFLCPDLDKIKAHASGAKGETPPSPIAGVAFERETSVRSAHG